MDDATPPGTPSLLDRPIVRGIVAAAILGALLVVVLVVRSTRDDGGAPSPAGALTPGAPTEASDVGLGPLDGQAPIVGQVAPDFALRRTDGTVVKLSDLRGTVVWINFWASWCVPCRKVLPDIQKVYDEKHAAGLEVLTVNWKDDLATATGFFSERGLSLPLLLDPSGAVYDQYRLQGLPDSFFIDREGKVAALQFGFLTEDKMRERLKTAGIE